jgi:hypothetical protein
VLRRTLAIVAVLTTALVGVDPAGAAGPLLGFHGDSMGAQARTQITAKLSQDHQPVVRARERAVIDTMTPGIQELVERPVPPQIVIVELGSGDAQERHTDAGIRADIRRVLHLTRDIPCVRWLSLKIAGVNAFYQSYVERADDFNRILAQEVGRHANARVAPYRQWAAAHPNSFKADGLHHTEPGKTRFAAFIDHVADNCPG